MSGHKPQFNVEPIVPDHARKWHNPDGDDRFRLTVTNPADQPLEVPALLTDGNDVRWDWSVAVICPHKTHSLVPAGQKAPKLQPVTLQPGQSVSGIVDVLALDGVKWPRGGSRVEFQFCLGEKSQTHCLYYHSKHHDPLRKAADGPTPAR
jgi:hypothetical protein